MSTQSKLKAGQALVIETYSREMAIRTATGDVVRARIKGKKLKPVCGDIVRAEQIPHEQEWLIGGIENRLNELARPNSRGKREVLAANLDNLCVVTASVPTADWYIVDRYLCAAEFMRIRAIVVYNKLDLDTDPAASSGALEVYRRIGYSTIACSARSGYNMEEFVALLQSQRSIIVGQSGVGKSSLINKICEDTNLRTAAVSTASGEGRHTTVNSSMLILSNGAEVIDSPGVRDFAPAIENTQQAIEGFREISAAGSNCRFANCQHQREPDCEVKSLVESGQIDKRRYESFRRLVVLTEQLTKKRY